MNHFCDCSSSVSCSKNYFCTAAAAIVHVRDSVQVPPGGAENTHWNIHREIIAIFFGSSFSDVKVFKQSERSAHMWRRLRNIHVRLHVRANGDSSVSLAMTHMRWLHGQSGHESTGYTQSGPQCRWVASLAHGHVLRQGRGQKLKQDPDPLVSAKRRTEKSKSDKTTLSKFTCVDSETFWKVQPATQHLHAFAHQVGCVIASNI